MAERTYHHGSLRQALLEAARGGLREDGVERLSLRELARRAGVSHGAPRHHFADRQALLDALAVDGFERLADEVAAAVDDAGDGPLERFRAAARAYLEFAVRDAALLELMFTSKVRDASREDLRGASGRLFAVLTEVVAEGQRAGGVVGSDPARLCLLIGATLQGVASWQAGERIDRAMADGLVEDLVGLVTARQ